MKLDDIKKLNIPKTPGSYQFLNKKGDIIYIGKAANLKSRILSYFQKSANHTLAKKKMVTEIHKIKWIETETEIEALLLEANLIKKHQPFYNIDKRDDKRFVYIKVSTQDEIPGVFITRDIKSAGKYYGPFTSVTAVKEALKVIRKVWPFCTERKFKKKICFYAQIGRCTGVCGRQFDLHDYKEKIIKPIILFLEGKKIKIINNYQLIINNYEKKLKSNRISDEEKDVVSHELIIFKKQLLNIKHVLSGAWVIGLEDKYAADVVELAKVLGLPKVPKRIEGYDISNIFGKEAVGSMVVFDDGEPNKKDYRKFKIKLREKSNDTQMLKEVLERRFNHLGEEKWSTPDLIIIDGGKGQLNAGLQMIKKFKLNIPVIAISKGKGLRSAHAPDKLFLPSEKKALELPLASPALHIIKRVRDESHRFAIKYHRELREKRWHKN